MVEGVEDLRLHGVEVRELVERFQAHVVQSCHWKRLEVQQFWKRGKKKEANFVALVVFVCRSSGGSICHITFVPEPAGK